MTDDRREIAPSSEPRIRVLVVDDHALFRMALRAFLEQDDGLTTLEAEDGPRALETMETLPVDVVLMDLSMPGMDGVETTRRMLGRWPDARIIVLTMHDKSSYLREALDLGARGFILKDGEVSEVLEAIHVVAGGGQFVSKELRSAVRSLEKHQTTSGGPKRGSH